MSVDFKKDKPLGEELYKWWKALEEYKGDRSAFSRAKNIQEIMLLPEFYRSLNRFRPFFKNEASWENQMAAVFGLLSHVREHTEEIGEMALQMAKPAESPIVSELRFRRLIQRERKDFYPALIRILRILKRKANLYHLARSVYYWGPQVKKQWANTYFTNIK